MDARPSVLPDDSQADLLGRDGGDSTDDGRRREAGAVGRFDADAILDQDDARVGTDERGDERRVVTAVRKGFGGYDDVVPLLRSGGGRGDVGIDGVGSECVVAERVRLEFDAVV